jgi:hypothetical protein
MVTAGSKGFEVTDWAYVLGAQRDMVQSATPRGHDHGNVISIGDAVMT